MLELLLCGKQVYLDTTRAAGDVRIVTIWHTGLSRYHSSCRRCYNCYFMVNRSIWIPHELQEMLELLLYGIQVSVDTTRAAGDVRIVTLW